MKRGSYKASAVILNTFDFGESDRVIVFYTKGFGKIKAVAKGARRSRKRFVGRLDPPALLDIVFSANGSGDLLRLEEATLLDGFSALKADVARLSYACYFLELTSEATREGIVHEEIFDLLEAFLIMLCNDGPDNGGGAREEALARFFEIRLLTAIGLRPRLDSCVVCKAAVNAEGRFSSEKGGVVCAGCSGKGAGLIKVSAGTAALLAMAGRIEAGKLARLKAPASFLKESEAVLHDFIRHQLGKELKTKGFMEKLKTAGF
jgi:DNA repair protein RecO (recombination protein O)